MQLVASEVVDSEGNPLPSSVGGLFGLIVGSSTVENVQFGSDLKVTAEGDSQKIFVIYVGGIIGHLNSTNKSTISNSKYSGTIGLTIPKSGKCYAGGIVGFMGPKASITKSKVSGDIKINAKLSASLYVGGIVGWIDAGSDSSVKCSVSTNYAWGNIEIDKENPSWLKLSALNVGGIVGYVGNIGDIEGSITGNYSLTSMYVFATANNSKICAIVGNTHSEDYVSDDNDYCHQINLVTDAKGQNLYYSNILSELTGEEKPLKNDVGAEGTKLKPYENPSLTAGLDEGYYVLTYNYTFASINKPSAVELKGHLVGDGYTISVTGSKSLFGTINGYISGVKIRFTSNQFNGTDSKGNVTSTSTNVPSGVADTNNGIIFAVSVEVSGCSSGFELLAAEFGKVQGTVVAGVVGKNTGKIADTGVVLNVKSAYAGFVGSNTGYIENCYSTGSVHNGAQYAFCNGEEKKGVVINSYTAIKAKKTYDLQSSVSNFYYDNAVVTSGNGTGKSTSELICTVGDLSGSNQITLKGSNGLVWTKNNAYNFGYPTFKTDDEDASKAYKGFAYLNIATKINNTFYLPHVGFLKLMSGKELSEKKNVYVFMTDMDLNGSWTAITTNAGTIDGQGYHIYNLSKSAFVANNTGTINNLSLIYAASENTISAVIDSNSGTLSGIIVSGATCTDAGLVKTNTGKITNCQNYNTVSGGANAGGIVSKMTAGTISGCRNFGSVTASAKGNAGGIVGKVPSSSTVSITNCANFGDITGKDYPKINDLYGFCYVGGIVGEYKLYTDTKEEITIGPGLYPYTGNTNYQFEIKDKNLVVKVYVMYLKEGDTNVGLKIVAYRGESSNTLYTLENLHSYSSNMNDWGGMRHFAHMYDDIAIFISFDFKYESDGRYEVKTELNVVDRFNYSANFCYNAGTLTCYKYTVPVSDDLREDNHENTVGQFFLWNYWDSIVKGSLSVHNYDEAKLNEDYSDPDSNTINVYTGAGLAYALYNCPNYTVNLMSDVDLSKYVWKPVSGFTGTFNGNGHKIYFGSNQNLFADDSVLTTDSDAYVVGVGDDAGMHIYERQFNHSTFTQYDGNNLWYSFGDKDDATLMWIKKKDGTYIYKFSYIKMAPSSYKLTYILIVEQIKNDSVEQTLVYTTGGYDEVKSSVTCTNPAEDFTTKVKIYGYNTKFKVLK